MDAFGLTAEMREKIRASQGEPQEMDFLSDGDFLVLEENWPALQIFLRCSTQWRFSMSGMTGLDYSAVIQVINLYEGEDTQKCFEDISFIEIGALNAIADRRK